MKTRNIFFIAVLSLLAFSVTAQEKSDFKYYMSKTIDVPYEEAVIKVTEVLKEQKFGIVTELDMHEKLAEKLPDVNIKPYKILGACNPAFAYETLKADDNIGLFLPCKILVKKIDDNTTEVVMVDPSVLMGMLGDDDLTEVANKVTESFKKAMDNL